MRRQKTAGAAGDRRFQQSNRPPQGENWIWITRKMLDSPAWMVMPLAARRVVDAIQSEHLQHAGTMNGELIVTYDNFMARGIRRSAIYKAIKSAEALGFIDVTQRGRRSYGSARQPNTYGLTWLPRCDGTAASQRWKSIKTADEAAAKLKAAPKATGREARASKQVERLSVRAAKAA